MGISTRFLTTVGAALVSAAFASQALAAEEKKHDETLIVVLSGPLKPYNYMDEDQKWKGLQAEALGYAADKAGYKLEYREMAFENEISALIQGGVDIGSGFSVINMVFVEFDFIALVIFIVGIITTDASGGV